MYCFVQPILFERVLECHMEPRWMINHCLGELFKKEKEKNAHSDEMGLNSSFQLPVTLEAMKGAFHTQLL